MATWQRSLMELCGVRVDGLDADRLEAVRSLARHPSIVGYETDVVSGNKAFHAPAPTCSCNAVRGVASLSSTASSICLTQNFCSGGAALSEDDAATLTWDAQEQRAATDARARAVVETSASAGRPCAKLFPRIAAMRAPRDPRRDSFAGSRETPPRQRRRVTARAAIRDPRHAVAGERFASRWSAVRR
jgi:hypothetical protein